MCNLHCDVQCMSYIVRHILFIHEPQTHTHIYSNAIKLNITSVTTTLHKLPLPSMTAYVSCDMYSESHHLLNRTTREEFATLYTTHLTTPHHSLYHTSYYTVALSIPHPVNTTHHSLNNKPLTKHHRPPTKHHTTQ